MSEKKKKVDEAIVQNLNFLPYSPWSTQGLYPDAWLTGAWGTTGLAPYSLAARYDDGSGMTRPVYITAFQKKQITDAARELSFFNEYCAAVIKIMQDYVIGTGFEYKVQAVRDGVNEKLVSQAQELMDLYCEHNKIWDFENELLWRLLVEGECCVRNFKQNNGLLTTRVVEPELLLPPNDSNDPDISFAIQCRKDDIHDIVGYWIVERPWEGLTPVLIPSEEVNFIKVNTPSNAKRGLPMSFQVDQNFRNCETLLLSMISLANARSKVAMVRKIDNSPPEAFRNFTAEHTDIILNDPITGKHIDIERLPYSSVLTSSKNVEYEFPNIGNFANEGIEVLQMNIRAICAHYGVSEMQLSSHTNNATYASAIVAESPSHKNFTRWQKMIGEFIAGRRTKPQQSLMWKQMIYAVETGMLPKNALTDLKITYRGPSVVARDQHEEAQSNKIYADMGVKSKQDIASEIGVNYDEQKRHKMEDDNLQDILAAVAQINQAKLDPEAAKELMKKYHPSVDDSLVDKLFKKQETNDRPEDFAFVPKQKDEPQPRPKAKVPKAPQPPR
jgi:capsid protein